MFTDSEDTSADGRENSLQKVLRRLHIGEVSGVGNLHEPRSADRLRHRASGYGGVTVSRVPTITSLGTVIRGSSGRLSGRRGHRQRLARDGFPVVSAHDF